MVALGGDAVHEALEAMYGKVWTSGVLPDSWNEARVSYLHKKGSKTEVSNYRPTIILDISPCKDIHHVMGWPPPGHGVQAHGEGTRLWPEGAGCP